MVFIGETGRPNPAKDFPKAPGVTTVASIAMIGSKEAADGNEYPSLLERVDSTRLKTYINALKSQNIVVLGTYDSVFVLPSDPEDNYDNYAQMMALEFLKIIDTFKLDGISITASLLTQGHCISIACAYLYAESVDFRAISMCQHLRDINLSAAYFEDLTLLSIRVVAAGFVVKLGLYVLRCSISQSTRKEEPHICGGILLMYTTIWCVCAGYGTRYL